MFNTGKFAQKTVFITGASRGIGKEIALKLARDGANIVVCAKTNTPHPKLPGTIYTTSEEIEKVGGKALPCIVDVRDENSIQSAVDAAVKEFGGIDILINNASAIFLTNTLDTAMKRYDLMHSVNTRGTFLATQKCIPYLKQAKNPHVLNLSPPLLMESQWFQHHVAYTMAKYGMSMCVLGMSEEFRSYGIAVNALWPKTAIWTAAMDMLSAGQGEAGCRKPSIVADAAYAMLSKNSRNYTGNFAIDEDVLKHEGITNFEQYACVPGASLMPDFFVPGIEYPSIKKTDKRQKSQTFIKTNDLEKILNEFQNAIEPEMIKNIKAVYYFILTDDSNTFNLYIDLKNGNGEAKMGQLSENQYDVKFEMTTNNFNEMVHNKLSPTQAFLNKKLNIKGNISKAIQLEAVIKQFVKKSKL